MNTPAYATMTKPAAAVVLALLLSACASRTSPPAQPLAPPPPPLQQSGCDAAGAQFAVGQVFNAPLAEQARQGARAETYRRLRPGQIVTMEFNGSRLNIDVDAGERILRVRCG